MRQILIDSGILLSYNQQKEPLHQAVLAPCISKEVRSYQRNQGVQPMNNETDLRRTISW